MVPIFTWALLETVAFGIAAGFAIVGVLLFTYWKIVDVLAWIGSGKTTPPKAGGRRGPTHAGSGLY